MTSVAQTCMLYDDIDALKRVLGESSPGCLIFALRAAFCWSPLSGSEDGVARSTSLSTKKRTILALLERRNGRGMLWPGSGP